MTGFHVMQLIQMLHTRMEESSVSHLSRSLVQVVGPATEGAHPNIHRSVPRVFELGYFNIISILCLLCRWG